MRGGRRAGGVKGGRVEGELEALVNYKRIKDEILILHTIFTKNHQITPWRQRTLKNRSALTRLGV